MARLALYFVPAMTVAVVTLALLSVGAPRSVVGARLWGGPTDGAAPWSFRVEVVELHPDGEQRSPERELTVALTDGEGRGDSTSVSMGATGSAELTLGTAGRTLATKLVTITTPARRRPLAQGPIRLDRAAWWGARRERGGPLDSPAAGPLRVRMSPGRGALAVPFASPLLVEVSHDDRAASGATLTARGEGLEVLAAAPPTNAHGRTHLVIRPTTHIAALELVARDASGAEGRWYATLPVVAGALEARLAGGSELLLRSPVPRERAHFMVFDRSGRLEGGSVALAADASGATTGSVRLRRGVPAEVWAVVSTEDDLASPGAVGWPLGDSIPAWLDGAVAAPRSVTLPEALLLDGLKPAVALELGRQGEVRRVTALFVVLALGLELLLVVGRVKAAAAALDRHLRRAAGDEIAASLTPGWGRTLFTVGVAVLSVGLGFLLIVLFALLRR